jgi:hypothetical protein
MTAETSIVAAARPAKAVWTDRYDVGKKALPSHASSQGPVLIWASLVGRVQSAAAAR